jgi:hypothetical protein
VRPQLLQAQDGNLHHGRVAQIVVIVTSMFDNNALGDDWTVDSAQAISST